MFRIRYLLISLSLLCSTVFAQPGYTYRYWFDSDDANAQTSEATSSLHLDIDVSGLSEALHTLYVQVVDNTGAASAPHVKHFFRVPAIDSSTAMRLVILIDDKEHKEETVAASGGIVHYDLDVSDVKEGLHYLEMMLVTQQGSVSSISSAYFLRVPKGNAKMKCFYALDGSEACQQAGEFADGAYKLDFEVKDLRIGLHRLSYFFVTEDGMVSDIRSTLFVRDIEPGKGIASYEYWVNSDSLTRQTVTLDEPVDTLRLTELQLAAQQFRTSGFEYEMKNGVGRVYNVNELSMRFYDANGGEVERGGSYGDMASALEVKGEWIYSDVPAHGHAPKENTIRWHKLNAEAGDSLVFNASVSCTLHLYSPSGIDVMERSGYETTAGTGCSAPETGTYWLALHDVEDATAGGTATVLYRNVTNPVNTVATPVLSLQGSSVSASCSTAGAAIYYQIEDGDTLAYNKPVAVDRNVTVTAFAVKEGLLDSAVDTFKVDIFKTAMPAIAYSEGKISISCGTKDSRIYYCVGEQWNETDSLCYTEPVPLAEPCVVWAIARRDGYNDSDTASYALERCAKPVISYADGMLNITCATGGASIYYSIDDGEVVAYAKPVEIGRNAAVHAFAVKEGMIDSDARDYAVDVFKTAAPMFAYDGESKLSIVCGTGGAAVYYRLQDEAEFHVYVEELALTDNRTVYACAKAEHMHDSDTLSFTPSNFRCEGVEIAFDEPWLSITCETEDAVIRYTIDGVEAEYTEPVRIDEPCTVTAFAEKEWFNNSDTIIYNVERCETPVIAFDGEALSISCATDGAVVRYRIDETMDEEAVYLEPVAIAHNFTVKAYAECGGILTSRESVLSIDTFTVAMPVLKFDEPWLTISCATEGTTICYIVDGVETEYTEPVRIDEPCEMAAFAEKKWFNNSDTIIYNVARCEDVKFSYSDGLLALACNTDGAAVYYTLDDSEPDTLSARYTEPVALSHNTKVRAVAYKQGMLRSGVSEYVVDVFKTASPVFAYDGEGKLAVTCATAGATVYYRMQDKADFNVCPNELALTDNRTVYLMAKAESMHDSDTLSFTPSNFTCEGVEVVFDEPWITMACVTEGATIRYTIDGVETEYTEPVRIDEPCTVTAFAEKEWFNNSDTVVYNVERCESPVIAFDGEALSISCAMEGAVVRYKINETMDEEAVYSEPVAIAHNFTVTAYAERGGMLASRESTLAIDTFTVAMPVIAFDDPWLTIGCATEGAVIHYTLDGTEPTAESPVYEGPVELYESCEVRAFAMREYMNDSETASLDVKIEAPPVDEYELVTEDVGGYVAVAVDGVLDEEGLRKVVELNPLYIDLSRAEVETLPDGAFEKCSNLAAVKWFELSDVKVNTLGCANPNLLFYCTDKSLVPSDTRNVIVGGKAESVALRDLTDEEALLTRGNFYCPESFEARRIGYEHTYGMKTGRGSSEGWETLALPFDVQSVYNKTKKTDAVPFGRYDKAAAGSSGPKPFWLYESDGDAFVPSSTIHANRPYIVSMPNNDAYLAEFNIPGNVEFSAEDATVAKTKLPSTPQRHDDMFIATMTHIQATDNVYAINKYDAIDGYSEGSVFVRALRDVQPFEAYFHSADARQKVIRISDISNGKADSIEDVGADAETEATDPHALYNLQGQRVDRNYRGIVITNGRKVVKRR